MTENSKTLDVTPPRPGAESGEPPELTPAECDAIWGLVRQARASGDGFDRPERAAEAVDEDGRRGGGR